MRYNTKYFRDSMPEWKRKKDPLICRFFYRPISFFIASLCANAKISANTISYFSILVALASGLFFLTGSFVNNIIAAILLNVWIILDCVDGNLARSVKKQPFGEFADAISGYIVTAVSCLSMGYSSFLSGGILFPKASILVVMLGAFAAMSDPLMRLIYQKYKATVRDLQDHGFEIHETDNHQDHSQVSSLLTRIEEVLGFGGILPAVVLLAVIYNALDVVVIYCALYYGGSCFAMTLKYIYKAIKNENSHELV